MNYMHQVYNDINLQKQENLTTIELEVKKSVFKHLMIPFGLTILIFTVVGLSALHSVLTNDPEGGFFLLIWGCILGLFSYKTLTECLWLLYAKERITLDCHQITIEKTYPVLHFQKNYIETIQIKYSEIQKIKYRFWQQPNAKLNLPKVTDGQIQIKTESEKYYIGINLSQVEAERVIAVINHLMHQYYPR